jgi:hypothetical protein
MNFCYTSMGGRFYNVSRLPCRWGIRPIAPPARGAEEEVEQAKRFGLSYTQHSLMSDHLLRES